MRRDRDKRTKDGEADGALEGPGDRAAPKASTERDRQMDEEQTERARSQRG